MPTTRRSTGGARARPGPAKGQSTISFANRVSKPVARDDVKKAVVASDKAEKVVTKELPEAEVVPAKVDVEAEPEEEEPETLEEPEPVPEKSEAEVRAEKISDTQIRKYWQGIEAVRIAPRVHIEDATVGEKVLRYFDVSSQYGVSFTPHVCTPKDCVLTGVAMRRDSTTEALAAC